MHVLGVQLDRTGEETTVFEIQRPEQMVRIAGVMGPEFFVLVSTNTGGGSESSILTDIVSPTHADEICRDQIIRHGSVA